MKKIKLILALVLMLNATVNAQTKLSADDVGAKAFILLDVDSQRVLSHYRATERLSPASITKLMTAYVVYKTLEKGLLDVQDTTVISQNARNMTEGSRMFLERGSRVSIDDLLHGLVIQSGNDAAVALAEAVSGSEENFIQQMNDYATSLGMRNSQFKNVTGLTEEGHYMSAQDIATLANAIITEFPEHYALYKEKSFTWNNITQDNRNALLRTDASVDGLKTGYTEAAGYCLTASAKRDDMRLISVVLGTKSVGARARASRKMLAYGFENFVERTLVKAGEKMAVAAVIDGEDEHVAIAAHKAIRLPVSKADKDTIGAQLVLNQKLYAPVQKGQVVGKIVIKQGERVIASTPAVTMESVEELGFFAKLWKDWFG